MNDELTVSAPDKKLAAVCGLFCPSCTLFISTAEEPDRLETIAQRIPIPVEELKCLGCRSEKRGFFCRNHCKMTKCEKEKGIDFCVECSEYPCSELKAFQAQMPHRSELFTSQERIKQVGYEKWYEEMAEYYTCAECGTINSAYDIQCRKCGATPSCEYVKLHKDEVTKNPSKLSR